MFPKYWSVILCGVMLISILGCARSDPVYPQIDPEPVCHNSTNASGHSCWGLWEIQCNPDTGAIDTIPLRSASFNANVVRFLQPPSSPIHLLTISLGPGSDIPNGLWVLNISFRHPFLEHSKFRGFDVRGIIMAEGGVAGIHDPTISYHQADGTRLLNPDGYTRWWNQQEFTTYETILGYTEGAKSTPGFISTATLNPYKLHTDALDETTPLILMDPDMRATFATNPGINTREYRIQFDIDGGPPPIRFKYAVDASWSLPDPSYAPEYPIEAYDLSANCQEIYILNVPHFEEKPYYVNESTYGGDAVFLLTIGDWQAESPEMVPDQLSHIWVESPTLLDVPIDVLPTAEFVNSNHFTQATFRCTVPNCHPTGTLDQILLITAESANPATYAPQIEGDPNAFDWPASPLAAYNIIEVPISPEAPPQTDEYWVVGLPDWCSLTEHCTNGADNLQFVTNLVQWDLEGEYNDNDIVKWWDGHVTPTPPYSTTIIQNHVNSLGYTFMRTSEPVFDPAGCRLVIVNFVRGGGASYLPFTAGEVSDMKDFVADGGVLCVLIENPNYFDPVEFDPLMDALGVPLGYGGYVEPPSTTTITTEISQHYLTTDVASWQYWTCGEFVLESDECVSLVRSPTGEHMAVLAPMDVD